MQAKRMQELSNTLDGVTPQRSVFFTVPTDVREEANFHNIWISFGLEPTTAGANANGIWVLWKKQNITAADPVWSTANINAETFNNMVIACGAWVASNETPYNFMTQLKTSRNLMPNETLVLSINQQGLTAGASQITALICAHVTRK